MLLLYVYVDCWSGVQVCVPVPVVGHAVETAKAARAKMKLSSKMSETLDGLIADARAAEFPTLCAVYRWEGADDFVDKVTVQFDDSTFVVNASQFGDPPDRLQALINKLRQIVDRPL